MSRPDPLSCDEALRRLAEYLDHELESGEAERVARHLALCRRCFSRAEFERRLRERLATVRRRPVDHALEQRIRALVAAPPGPADGPAHH